MAAVDYFLKLTEITGESKDHKHKDAIQLESWSWGESNSGSHSHGSGGGAGKVSMQDFNFTMKMNKASPQLMLACASGKHIKEGTLTCRKAGEKQQEFFTIKFTDLLVSSYQTGGSAHSDIIPTDQISVNFAKIQLEYKVQNPDGTLGGGATAGWDVQSNQKA